MAVKSKRTPRKYSLYFKQGRKWVRIYPHMAFYKEQAIHIFQSDLLYPYYRGQAVTKELRPVN